MDFQIDKKILVVLNLMLIECEHLFIISIINEELFLLVVLTIL